MDNNDLEARIALLEKRSAKSANDRGLLWALSCLAAITLFGIGFKVTTDDSGKDHYGWNLEASAIVNILTVLTGGSAIGAGLMAAKNLRGSEENKN
jgi:hypothetical protein